MKTAVLFATLFAIVAWFAIAGVVMLAVGAAHHAEPTIPALGYVATAWLTLAVGLVANPPKITLKAGRS